MIAYILQIVENDAVGTIRDVRITKDIKVAKRWFAKQPKTTRYSHGYQTIDIEGSS